MRIHKQKPKSTQFEQFQKSRFTTPAHPGRPKCASSRIDSDFSQIPSLAFTRRSIQPKLKIGTPGDKLEREADQVAARVVQQRLPATRDRGNTAKQNKPQTLKIRSTPGSTLGKPLDSSTKEEMSHKFGFDFSNVHIHTGESANYLNTGLNARAFTYGSDIFFNKGEYNPYSSAGKRLLAHELTHVVQQSGMTGGGVQREMIQRTSIGQVLDKFFSPFSSEKLWVMKEKDNYTRIVRTWQPVIDLVKKAKTNLQAKCKTWGAKHNTSSSWKPGKTDPPVVDPNAHPTTRGMWKYHPAGTEPEVCKKAFIIYATTKASLAPTIQTFELYTCSIGSFGIYPTVDSIDCAAKTAKMNIWMYNSMSKRSFGRYAGHPVFKLSGMKKQYMWWNWSESLNWGSSPSKGGGSAGGSSKWT